MAACLLLVGLTVLATVTLRQAKRASPALLVATGEGAGLIDRRLGKAMQQVGPVPLIAIAFLAGLLMSRGKVTLGSGVVRDRTSVRLRDLEQTNLFDQLETSA